VQHDITLVLLYRSIVNIISFQNKIPLKMNNMLKRKLN